MFLNIFRPYKDEFTSILEEEIIKGDKGKFKNLIIDKNSITITEHYDVTTMEPTSQDNPIMSISTTPGTTDSTSTTTDTTTTLTTASITTTHSCIFTENNGDGICDDKLNTNLCNFDGGDCCLDEYTIVTLFCIECICYESNNTTPNSCNDIQNSSTCSILASYGYCEEGKQNEDYMKLNCKQTCGKCEHEITTTQPDNSICSMIFFS